MRLGAVEAGGTKFVCAICEENGEIREKAVFPTKTPEVTMPKVIDFLKAGKVDTVGIACFGPIELRRKAAKYGCILSTPKLAWRDYPIVEKVREALGVPVGFDTDVNGSMLGEAVYGCAKGLSNALYLTIGTGIGGGVLSNGKLLHGFLHPELGHMPVAILPEDPMTHGVCPYHISCLEGLASGPAIEKRWGRPAAELFDRPEVWELESSYLAAALAVYICTLSPEKIILGGGVMKQAQLLPLIREKTAAILNGYLVRPALSDMDAYIVGESLSGDQGILGAAWLGFQEVSRQVSSVN